MRVLWVDPIGSDAFSTITLETLGKASRHDTVVDFISLPPDRPQHLEYRAYEGLVIADIVNIVYQLSNDYDAFIIGCFHDVGLREAREVSDKALVVAPCQAALDIASHLGNSFSVLVGRSKWVPRVKENIRLYGRSHALASIHSLDVNVCDFSDESEQVYERLLQAGRKAVDEDGAEVLILGCTADYHSFHRLQSELGVPVVDSVIAPFKYAEMLAENAARFGWYHSRKWGSESPPSAEVREGDFFGRQLSNIINLKE